MVGDKEAYIILRDKSTRFRIVVSYLEIVKSRFCIVIVASVSYGVYETDIICVGYLVPAFVHNLMIAPCVIYVSCLKCVVGIINMRNVAHQILAEVVNCTVILNTYDSVNSIYEIQRNRSITLSCKGATYFLLNKLYRIYRRLSIYENPEG